MRISGGNVGSMRASELVGTDPEKLYPTKTLCLSDIKTVEMEAQDEKG